MKEMLIPYILICWILVKMGIVTWNLRNAVKMVGIGFGILMVLFFGHRIWSPVDMTNSTTVKAPHATLAPFMGMQVNEVFVDHNQKVTKGQLLYTQVNVDTQSSIEALNAEKQALLAQITAHKAQKTADVHTIKNIESNYRRLSKMGNFAAEQNLDDVKAQLNTARAASAAVDAAIHAVRSQIVGVEARLKTAQWQDERKEVRAPFDGQVSVVNISAGTIFGGIHLYDTSRKFVEMRIADQTYNYIEPGQFSEFYVDAFPGKTFRGRVHSIRTGTGEAQVSLMPGDQHVRQHIGNNMSAHGRTVLIEFDENMNGGYDIPIGSSGQAWISAKKPASVGFIDMIGGATMRLTAMKSYLMAL
ncbi:hemolysin D [Vibrio sp. 10N.286.51.C3]|uniref:HlyD family secretion protein n=1 Tax=unclassified Vibrio TaxID=2614977 RepID=UPI000D3D9E5D|nr:MULTISPECIES: efflux RND transporter periplasmic adaptor subunit [unclassified Vibrio]CAK3977157.1 Hemolysin D [Vibrio crassostreae]PTP15409.1 hemolysin D [Vibrio sp. 10N.286.51.C3]PTQ02705.1 hemolysin D [Vibrio sp. ZF 223]TKE63528.1 hemolysin D [Vibrio sp. F12]TKE88678.1 hemolysin D [Vibrio sp. F12]